MTLTQLQDYFARLAPESMLGFCINLILAVVLTTILSRLYVKYGRSFSDRNILARNLILITLTTMMVITVIKSSLALSLGLVGALSIVRFRTAIKEPEELAYLFISIGIGLGLGASAHKATVLACSVIFFIIWYRAQGDQQRVNPNLSLILTKDLTKAKGSIPGIQQLVDISKQYCQRVDVIRFEESDKFLEASFHIECKSFNDVQRMRESFRDLDESIYITFIDNNAGKTL